MVDCLFFAFFAAFRLVGEKNNLQTDVTAVKQEVSELGQTAQELNKISEEKNTKIQEMNKKQMDLKNEYLNLKSKQPNSVNSSKINDMFDWLPLAAVIEDRIVCLHGGIGSTLVSLD